MTIREVQVGHRLGLHARAAARLVQLSREFQSTIRIGRAEASGNAEADARSILSILLLSAGYGTRLNVMAEGADEAEAVDRICQYISE